MAPNRLKELRERMGLKQADLERVAGKAQPMLSRYESGEIPPPLDVVRRLARFYDVSVSYLLGWDLLSEGTFPDPTDKAAA